MDMNDRSLRHIIVGAGGKANGVVREDGFNITPASEIMAILCMSKDLDDLKKRMGNIYIGQTYDKEPVYAKDMAEAVGKKILPIQPWMARFAFFFFWHATRGRIPTCPGSWRFYSYPVLMNGEKLSEVYTCKYSSPEAFSKTSGRYESYVPESERKS
mgnify:CR=1 FL=1